MATIPQNYTEYMRALRRDPVAWAEIRASNPKNLEVKAMFQGMENWFTSNPVRASAKAAMEAEAGISIYNTLAKKIAKVYMQLKWGGE